MLWWFLLSLLLLNNKVKSLKFGVAGYTLPESMASYSYLHSVTSNGILYLFGGATKQDVIKWEPSNPTVWVSILQTPKEIWSGGQLAVTVFDGYHEYIYIVAYGSKSATLKFNTTSEKFVSNGISLITGCCGCLATDGTNKLYYIGAGDGSELTILDIENSNTWDHGAYVPGGLLITTACAYVATNNGDYIYAFGGVTGHLEYSNSIFRYDVSDNSWATLSDTLPSVTTYSRAIYSVGENKVYLVGGEDGNGGNIFDEVIQLDISSNSVTGITHMNYARYQHIVVIIDDLLYVMGSPGTDLRSIEMATVATLSPTFKPTSMPTIIPTINPTQYPTTDPTIQPTQIPTVTPTQIPTNDPTINPTFQPTNIPTTQPTNDPTYTPTTNPTVNPTNDPTQIPTNDPTNDPTVQPTQIPTIIPTTIPTTNPTFEPTINPTFYPTFEPSQIPSDEPTPIPTPLPSYNPSNNPTSKPTNTPTLRPTDASAAPTLIPTPSPTSNPTIQPTFNPTKNPTTEPTNHPTTYPSTTNPTTHTTYIPTHNPTFDPTNYPTTEPTNIPSVHPTTEPTKFPTSDPSFSPTTPSPTDPGILQCGDEVTGAFNNQQISFSVQTNFHGDLTFNATNSDFNITTLIATDSRNTFIISDTDNNDIVTIYEVPAAIYIITMDAPHETIGTYDLIISCTSHSPTLAPSYIPSVSPIIYSSDHDEPTVLPTTNPAVDPTNINDPTSDPSKYPTIIPTNNPTMHATMQATMQSAMHPTINPSITPSNIQSMNPTMIPTMNLANKPTNNPSVNPTMNPSINTSTNPSINPIVNPTNNPTFYPTKYPSLKANATLMINLANETIAYPLQYSSKSMDKLEYVWLSVVCIPLFCLVMYCILSRCRDVNTIVVDKALVLIIGITKFDGMKDLPKDRLNIKKLKELWEFTYKYDVFICNENTMYCTKQDVIDFIDEYKCRLQNQLYKAVIVHVITHGGENDIFYTSDGRQLSLEFIKHEIVGSAEFEGNISILKLMFYHACRGHANYSIEHTRTTTQSIDETFENNDNGICDWLNKTRNMKYNTDNKCITIKYKSITESKLSNNDDGTWLSPDYNFVTMYQTIIGRTTNSDQGYFTGAICQVFNNNAEKKRNKDTLFALTDKIGIKLAEMTNEADIMTVEYTTMRYKVKFEEYCWTKQQKQIMDIVNENDIEMAYTKTINTGCEEDDEIPLSEEIFAYALNDKSRNYINVEMDGDTSEDSA